MNKVKFCKISVLVFSYVNMTEFDIIFWKSHIKKREKFVMIESIK